MIYPIYRTAQGEQRIISAITREHRLMQAGVVDRGWKMGESGCLTETYFAQKPKPVDWGNALSAFHQSERHRIIRGNGVFEMFFFLRGTRRFRVDLSVSPAWTLRIFCGAQSTSVPPPPPLTSCYNPPGVPADCTPPNYSGTSRSRRIKGHSGQLQSDKNRKKSYFKFRNARSLLCLLRPVS